MCIYKKRIPPIRLIRKRHLLPHLTLLILTHPRQSSLINLVQMIIIQPQPNDNKYQRRQRRNNTDLPRFIPGSFLLLEGLSS